MIGLCAAYVISPIDVAPEALLGPLGVPDDIVALVAAGAVYFAGIRAKRVPD